MSEPDFTQNIAMALLHFLWQGCAAGLGLAIVLPFLRQARYRYAASVFALFSLVAIFSITLLHSTERQTSGYNDSSSASAQTNERKTNAIHADLPSEKLQNIETLDFPVSEKPSALTSEISPSKTEPFAKTNWQMPIVIAWLLGIGFFGLRFIVDWVAAQKIRKESHEFSTESPWQNRFAKCLDEAGMRKVKILESANIIIPLAMGWLKPVVIIPTALVNSLSPQQVEAILWHELAHIRRHDYLINLIQSLVEVMFFFHPVVWWVSRQMRIEREYCCDEWATQMVGSRAEYASALAALEELKSAPSARLAVAANGAEKGSLLLRLRYLCGKRSRNAHWPMITLGSVGAVTAVWMLLSVFASSGVAQDEKEKKRKKGYIPVDATIKVTVTDENMRPVPNPEVWIWRGQNASFMKDLVVAQGQGDSEGKFEAQSRVFDEFYHYSLAQSGDKVGVVNFSPRVSDDPGPVLLNIKLEATESVSAKISLPNGEPASGVLLRVYNCSIRQKRIWDSPLLPGDIWQARSDENGEVTISGIPKGAQILLCHEDERFAQFNREQETRVWAGSGIVSNLTLEEPRSISGQILAPDGSPIDYAWLLLSSDDEQWSGVIKDKFETYDPEGRFVIPNLPAGKYRVTAMIGHNEGENWLPTGATADLTKLKTVDVGQLKITESIPYTIRLLNAETREPIGEPIKDSGPEGGFEYYHRGNNISPPGYGNPIPEKITVNLKRGQENVVEVLLPPAKSYSGIVRDEAGNPVEGVQVLGSFPYHHGNGYFMTKADGKFLISPGEPTHAADIFAWHEKTEAISQPVHRLNTNRESIELILRNDSLAKLSGKVVDEEGNPIRQAEVTWDLEESPINDGPLTMWVKTNKDGEFDFPKVWSEIPIELEVVRRGIPLLKEKAFTLKPGEHREVELKFKRPNETVNGVVHRHDGSPAIGAWVNSDAGDGATKTNEDGAFTLTGLPEGNTSIKAWDTQDTYHTEIEKWIKIVDSKEVTSLELTLPESAGEISGTIRYENGEPLANVRLAAISRGRDTHTDSEGRFEIKGLMGDWMTLAIFPNGNTMVGRETGRIKTGHKDVEITIPKHTPSSLDPPKIVPLRVGDSALPIDVARWFGAPVDLAKKPEGKARLLVFWQPIDWIKEQLDPLYDKIIKEGENWPFEVVVITQDTNPREIEELMKEKQYPFPIGMTPKGSTYSRKWNTKRYAVVDTNNKIIFQGYRLKDALELVRD